MAVVKLTYQRLAAYIAVALETHIYRTRLSSIISVKHFCASGTEVRRRSSYHIQVLHTTAWPCIANIHMGDSSSSNVEITPA